MPKPGLAARTAALQILNGVTEDQKMLTEAIAPAVSGLGLPDRARAQRLATDTLRWMDRADRMLGPQLRRKPPPEVLNILRLALAEIYVEQAAAHAVVDGAVSLARQQRRGKPMSGLVNAVLRKLAAEGPEAWNALPLPRLTKALRKALTAAYGKAVVEAMERAHAAGAGLDLTPKAAEPQALASRLGGEILPSGSVRLAGQTQVSALPGYGEGDWWVQDAAAALAARVLAARPGENVLDICAAPGGKTLQLAAAGARVTALDISRARLGRLRENLARTGLEARVVSADALDWTPPADAPGFDAILLDAPCSATGTIRRHPDLPRLRGLDDLAALADLQARLIDRAVAWLAPGGRLVFCTCSLLPQEGEDQAAAARDRHPALQGDAAALAVDGVAPEWIGRAGLRLRPDYWPEHGGMDGFFIAAFRKSA